MKTKMLLSAVGLAAALAGSVVAQAQPLLDCSCLATQAVLFTNTCSGYIPDLCGVASNCYSSSIVPPPGYTCTQTPAPGTFVTSSTAITFTLTENITSNSATCTVAFYVGASTTGFALVCPPNQVVPCNTTNWTFPVPTWTNTCCTNVTVTQISLVTNWPTITATWQGIDCYGAADTCSQSITFSTTNGTACNCLDILCPSNIVVQTCFPPIPSSAWITNVNYPLPTVTNHCIGVVTNLVCLPPPGSPFPVGTNTVGCTVYDNLGNSATCTFDVIVLGDTTPPVITCAGNQTYQCGSAWTPIRPTAFDACCGTNVIITLLGAVTNTTGTCQQLITVTWDAMDCNGNHTNCSDVITIVDTTPPVITCVSNQTVQCGGTGSTGWVPTPPPAIDACCGTNVTVSLVSAITNGSVPCNANVTLTWKAVDCCSNASFCTQVVNIVHTNPPTITCAPAKTVECGSSWTFDPPTAFDTCCGTNVTITTLSNVTVFASTCLSVYVQYWMATGCCSNSAICSQQVTVRDTQPPVLSCPSNFTTNYGSTWSFTPPTASDTCCGTNVTVVVQSTVTNGAGCPQVITRTWKAVDCCGNATNCSQTVTIIGGPAPPNDLCANAIPVFAGSPAYCGTTACATPSTNIPPPCGLSINSPDVWFTFTPVCTGPVTINTCGLCTNQSPAFDTVLSAYTGTCGSLTQVACNDDTGGPCGLQSTITFNGTAGVTYYLRVAGHLGASGLFRLNIIAPNSPPPNDLFQNAIPVQIGSPAACGTTVCATPSPVGSIPVPCGASINSRDVWYTWTPQCSGVATIDTCGLCPGQTTTFNTVLSVYWGPCGSLWPVACNDNAVGFPPCSPQSRLSFFATAGVTYTIRVAGFDTTLAGPFRLNIAQALAPPPNDLCANATPLPSSGVAPFYTCGANTDGPTQLGCQPNSDVWFTYTAACSGQVWADTCVASFNTVLSVYTGPCTSLSLVACNDNATAGPCNGSQQSFLTFNAVAGTTYHIRVGGVGAAQGWGVLRVQGPYPAANTCPPAGGPCYWRIFQVLGTANNTPWAWSIREACCANVTVTNVPGLPVGSTATQLAQAFINSINAACGGNGIQAIGPFNWFSWNALFAVCVKSCGSTPMPFTFSIGPAGTIAQNQCVVGNLYSPIWPPLPLPTFGPCSFNPPLIELPYANTDLNNNGIDDAFDIMSGNSADLNMNGIPDEAEACQVPQVLTQPDSPQVVPLGTNVTLTASATGTEPLSYQWTLNGVALDGQTAPELTLNGITADQMGDYGLIVANACGTNVLGPITLMADTTPAPVEPYITALDLLDGTFQLTFATKTGQTYTVEYKNNLTDSSWQELATVSGDGEEHTVTDTPSLPSSRFYRIRMTVP